MKKQIYNFSLLDSEKQALAAALARLPYDPNGFCQYINELRIIALSALPKRVIEAFVRQKTSLQPLPFIVIDNLPTDSVYRVPLPHEDSRTCKSGQISENLILAISSLVGEPYSITFEGESIVNNLIPTLATRNDFTGLGSGVELDFHIENAALKYLRGQDYSPLGLFLSGVAFDPRGPGTLVADGRKALGLLAKDDLELLKSPLFQIKVPYRWREALGVAACLTDPVPIVRDDSDYPDIAAAFYSDIVTPLTAPARAALDKFHLAIKSVAVRMEIKPGKLVYIDNRFALHSREAFDSSFDDLGRAQRWVQRVFVAPSLWNHRKLIRSKHRVFYPQKVG